LGNTSKVAGVDISVRIYIDRVLVATIPLLTK